MDSNVKMLIHPARSRRRGLGQAGGRAVDRPRMSTASSRSASLLRSCFGTVQRSFAQWVCQSMVAETDRHTERDETRRGPADCYCHRGWGGVAPSCGGLWLSQVCAAAASPTPALRARARLSRGGPAALSTDQGQHRLGLLRSLPRGPGQDLRLFRTQPSR